MYESYFGLSERPFDLSPNPRFLFLSRRHSEALAHLRYGLSRRSGLTVLIGEAGTGKTTLVRAALQTPENQPALNGHVVHLSNPTLTRAEFYEYLSAGFGCSSTAAQSKTQFLRELESALEALPDDHGGLALIADEAQSIPHELLEEIRLLTNIQSKNGRALTVVLVGQPELAQRLNEDRLRQLKQRVALRCELTPLDLQETAAYIATRIRVANGKPEQIFSRDAISVTYHYSRGIPRTISVICDSAMVNGFAADHRPVGREIVLEVCRDFEIPEPATLQRQVATPQRQAATPQRQAAPPAQHTKSVEQKPVPVAKETVATQPPATPQKGLFSTFERRRRFFIF